MDNSTAIINLTVTKLTMANSTNTTSSDKYFSGHSGADETIMTSDELKVVDDLFIWLIGVVGGCVNIFGLVGNVLSLITLCQRQLR